MNITFPNRFHLIRLPVLVVLMLGLLFGRPTNASAQSASLYSSGSLVNQLTGFVLADPQSSTAAGTQMIQWQANGYYDQDWYAEPQGNGYINLVNVSSGLYLTASGTTAGSPVTQSPTDASADQLWLVTPNGNGFLIQNQASGLYLDNGSNLSEGGGIVLAARSGSSSQTWLNNNSVPVELTNANTYRITNVGTSLALADPASSPESNTPMITWQGNGYADQSWCFCGVWAGGLVIQNTSSGLVLTDSGTSFSSSVAQEPYYASATQAWLVTQSANGYVLQNVGTGRVLDAPSTTPGNMVALDQQNGSSSQLWTVSPSASLPDGYYTLTNAASSLLMADPASSLSVGTQIISWPSNSYRDQSWHFVSQGNGYYSITNLASGVLIGDTNGARLVQDATSIDDAHLWYLTASSAEGYSITNKATGRTIDATSGAGQGTGIAVAYPNGALSQDWLFAPAITWVVPSGTYNLLTGATDGLALADPASSAAPGTQIIQWTPNGYADQTWSIVAASGGFYTIQNGASQLYLTASAGALLQEPPDGANDQLWSLPQADGPLVLTNSATGQVLQPANNNVGSAILIAPNTPSNSQPWALGYVATNSNPTLSSTSHAFGEAIVGTSNTQPVVTITNPASATAQLSFSLLGDSSYSLASGGTCGSSLAGGASCTVNVQYSPTLRGTQIASLQVAFSGDVQYSSTVTLTGTAEAVPAGSIAETVHPLVAEYTIAPGANATVTVQFGLDTTYGHTTAPVQATGSNPVTVLVAGMRANSQYHMQAIIAYANGQTVTSPDSTFNTGGLPSDLASLSLSVSTPNGLTPQPGVELLDPVNNGTPKPYAVDLQGNVIWYYPWADYNPNAQIDGFKIMPNGHYIAVIGALSSEPLTGIPTGTPIEVREIDLAGNIVKQLTLDDLNTRLTNAGYSVTLADFHHDVEVLPNGHWLILANTLQNVSGTVILGDVVVDVDTNFNPVFVWNEFDHFDTNRRPIGFPDWTHSNAVVYSPTDGNFIVSSRHQSWVVKVNYQNGAGDGSILWTLGYQGSFSLVNGTSPTDWQYGQHYPNFVGPNSAGVFSITMMDNGYGRMFPGGQCGTGSNPPCYTTVPIFQLDENAQTATIQWRHTLPPALYSYYAGNAEVLANGDVEYDLCGLATGSEIDEVTQDANQTLVWSLVTNGNAQYRAFRMPSLYPGVQWQ